MNFSGGKDLKGRALSSGNGQNVQNDGHKNRAKSDDKSVDSVRNQDFFNAGLSPYPHTTTFREIEPAARLFGSSFFSFVRVNGSFRSDVVVNNVSCIQSRNPGGCPI